MPISNKTGLRCKQPKYYGELKCLKSKCPNTCCAGWRINWERSAAEKLRSAPECSDRLRVLADTAFIPDSSGGYIISADEENGRRCPFLTNRSLCLIHKELGSSYLSSACRTYPKHIRLCGDAALRYGSSSCSAVISALFDDESSAELVRARTSVSAEKISGEPKSLTAMHPELMYREFLFDFFYELISDKSIPLYDTLILGAMAAKRLSDCVDENNLEHISALVEDIRVRYRNPDNLEILKNIRPNYTYKLGICAKIAEAAAGRGIMSGLYDGDALYIDKYLAAEEKFGEIYADKQYIFRNMALNMLFECSVPFMNIEHSIFENYSFYAASFAVIKLMGAASVLTCGDDAESRYRLAVTSVSRKLFRSESGYELIINTLKTFKCTSPATLAVLIK